MWSKKNFKNTIIFYINSRYSEIKCYIVPILALITNCSNYIGLVYLKKYNQSVVLSKCLHHHVCGLPNSAPTFRT